MRPAEVEEETSGDPVTVAEANAVRKAEAVSGGEVVVGCDTVVALDGAILGKPRDAGQARRFLAHLAGREHAVISGLAVTRGGELRSGTARTAVRFRPVDDAALHRYVDSGEWRGRAGGYAIQGRGAALVTRIEGDYFNVVGLPVALLLDLVPDLLELSV